MRPSFKAGAYAIFGAVWPFLVMGVLALFGSLNQYLAIFLGGFWLLFLLTINYYWPEAETRYRLVAVRRATPDEAQAFRPDKYVRLMWRKGRRLVVLGVDDGIDDPEADIVPTQTFPDLVVFKDVVVMWSQPVLFEYKDHLFYGRWFR